MVNPVAAGSISSKRRHGAPFGSWWFCGQAARNCHSILLLMSWIFFFCMPFCVMGNEMVSYDIFNQEMMHTSLNVNGEVSASGKGLKLSVTVLESIRRTKEQKETQPTSKDDPFELPKLAIEVTSYQQDGYDIGHSQEVWEYETSMENRNWGEGYGVFDQLWSSSNDHMQESTVACFSSRVSSLMNHAFSEALPLHGEPEKAHQSFQGSVSSLPNVAIFPPILEWKSQSLYSPSVGYLTVLNTCNSSVLHVSQPFSTNSQFFVFGLKESIISPGGMLSIPITFLPTALGLVEGLLVVQTSAGSFLVQTRGEGVTSPCMLQSLSGLHAFSGMKLQHPVFLYNPYDEPLHVEEVYVWISDTGNQCTPPFATETDRGKGVLCKRGVIMPEAAMGGAGWMQILPDGSHSSNLNDVFVELRPSGDWTIGPHYGHSVVELGITINNDVSVVGSLCIRITRQQNKVSETVVLPLKVQPMKSTSSFKNFYVVPEVLDFGVLSENQKRKQSIVIVNKGSQFLRVNRIFSSSEDINIFNVEYEHGLVIGPGTENQVASITYAGIKQRTCWPYNRCSTIDSCDLTIQTNVTDIKVPYQAVVLFGPSECLYLDSSSAVPGYVEDACLKPRHQVHLQNGCIVPFPIVRELEKRIWAANWAVNGKLPHTVSDLEATSISQSVLETPDLLFSLVQLGMEEVQWLTVINPSDKPVKMELMVSSEAGASQCKQEEGESDVNHILNHIKLTDDSRIGSTSIGGQEGMAARSGIFSVAEGGVFDALVQPKGKAMLGPLVFRPMERCVWTSLLVIHNNLTGIEWLPVQGTGGSCGLTFLHRNTAVKDLSLDFNLMAPREGIIKQRIHELISHAAAKASCHQHITREFQVKNSGDMPLQVETITLVGGVCDSHGFILDSCNGFYLSPGQTTQLMISYKPDFSGVFNQQLQVLTSFGMLTIPIKANLAPELLPFCQKPSFLLKFEKLLLHICLVALFLVLIIFIRMLKQERLSSPTDSGYWPSGSPTKLFSPDELKISRKVKEKDSGRQRLKTIDPISPTKNSVHTGSPSCKACYNHSRIFIAVSSFLAPIKSLCSLLDVVFDAIKLKILGIQAPAADFVKLSASTAKPGNACLSNVSSKAAGRKGTHVGNIISKVQLQSPTQTNVNQGGINMTSNSSSSEITPHQQEPHPATTPLPSVVPGSSSSSLPQIESHVQEIFMTQSELTCQKGSQMATQTESHLEEICTTQSQCQKGSQTSKTGLFEEKKERGKKKKKKITTSVSKQEVENGNQSGNSSPVSSPPSPATPVSVSRPVSPFLPLESLSTAATVLINENDLSLLKHKRNRSLDSDGSTQCPTKNLPLKIMDAACTVLQKRITAIANTSHSIQPTANMKRKARGMNVKEGACGPGKTVSVPKVVHAQDLEKPLSAWELDKTANTRPVLKTSATFPGGVRNSGQNASNQGENRQCANVSTSGILHGSSSAVTPIGRAPGTRLAKQKMEKTEKNAGLQDDPSPAYEGCLASYSAEQNNKENIQADNFVYDIWGDHFAEISRGPRYNEVAFLGQACLVEDSQSLFAKSAFMDSSSSLTAFIAACTPVSPPDSSLSVYSTTDCLFTSHRLSPLLSDWMPE